MDFSEVDLAAAISRTLRRETYLASSFTIVLRKLRHRRVDHLARFLPCENFVG